MDDMKSEDPMRRMFALGRAKRALANYDEKEVLTSFDKRLLKGFYTKDKWELVNSSEEESLKFSAKIDRGRVRGLISRYLTNKDRGQNEAGKKEKAEIALKYHNQHMAKDPKREIGWAYSNLSKVNYDNKIIYLDPCNDNKEAIDCWDPKFDDEKAKDFT